MQTRRKRIVAREGQVYGVKRGNAYEIYRGKYAVAWQMYRVMNRGGYDVLVGERVGINAIRVYDDGTCDVAGFDTFYTR